MGIAQKQLVVALAAGLVLLALTASPVRASGSTSSGGEDEPSGCDQTRFFMCASDGACIPRAWLADGEPDCADGTDESDELYAALQKTRPPPGVTRASAKSKQAPVDRDLAMTEERDEEDLFAVTTTASAAATVASGNCSPAQSAEARKCAADVSAWLDELEADLRGTSPSLFRNESTLSRVERGCALLPSYLSCVDALPAACERQAHAARLVDWLAVQTFLCELLTPSLREHYACFNDADGGDRSGESCNSKKLKPIRNSVVCALVGQAAADIDCVERAASANEHCDERARELFAPLRSETHNALEDLKCATTTAPATITTTTPTPTTNPTPVAVENEAPAESEARHVRPGTRKVARKPVTTTEAPAPNLSNALRTLANLETVCGSGAPRPAGDLWAPIRVKLCGRREAFSKHADCYAQVLRETEQQCVPKLERSTTCGAIDAFNQNVDCVSGALAAACAGEAHDLLVGVREKLNDEAIAHKCYAGTNDANTPINADGFRLAPKMARCDEAQENTAVTCLVELIEINRQLPQFASLNFLGELSDANSTLVNRICQLYTRYDECLRVNVFRNSTKQCAFNSPLNTLARIGLSPICEPETRQLIIDSRECLRDVGRQINAEHCQSGLQRLAGTVEMMLHGIHGEALLCKSFYVMRASFECGETVVRDKCDSAALDNIQRVKQKMSEIGLEEGCPPNEPTDLDVIIARPVAPGVTHAPIAHAPTAAAAPPPSSPCEPAALKQFNECIQPLVAFQPHPLAVIKVPKEIDAACRAFESFKQCRDADAAGCNPIWARGMAAMFEYSCGDGAETYSKVKTCVRRVTTRADIRDCVTAFSKSPPQDACRSANQLMACSLPYLDEKCGAEAVAFVREYMRRFTQVIDATCQLTDTSSSGSAHRIAPVKALNCTVAEAQTAERCAQPLVDVHLELEQLFQGGFQAFLKNVNNIAPIFARGCNLTNHFRQCARPVLERAEANESTCVLSSCFMRAGDGICDQANVAEAIDSNLQCVFKQVAVPEFSKCMRTTIATLRQFTLEALRDVLPKFVDCVEPIVLRACGSVPLNVLRALGSRNVCPVHSVNNDALTPSLTVVPAPPEETCTPALEREYNACMQPFLAKYDFVPASLLNRSNETTLCSDFDTLTQCIEKNRICEVTGKVKALRKLVMQICSNKHAFDQRADCLSEIVASPKGSECLAPYKEASSATNTHADDALCSALNATTECMAERIFEECPTDSVPFVYDYTNAYWRDMVGEKGVACELTAPTVSLQTGCPEEEFVNYLKCESYIDKYHFQPISIIRDPSMWEKFCMTVETDYRPCLETLNCKFEPTMSATLSLYQTACDSSSALGKMQASIAGCLGELTKSKHGDECLKPFASLDLLGRDASERICIVVDELLSCVAPQLNQNCGTDALEHVYTLHETWTRAFNTSCTLRRPSAAELTTISTEEASTTTPSSSRSRTATRFHTSKRIETTETSTESSTLPVEVTTKEMKTSTESSAVITEELTSSSTTKLITEAQTTATQQSSTNSSSITTESAVNFEPTATTPVNPKLDRTATGNGAVSDSLSRLLFTASMALLIFKAF